MHEIGNYIVVNGTIVDRATSLPMNFDDICVILDARTNSMMKCGYRDTIQRLLPNYAIRNDVPFVLYDFNDIDGCTADMACTLLNYFCRRSDEQLVPNARNLDINDVHNHIDDLRSSKF